jgi:radical SAM-linked protein
MRLVERLAVRAGLPLRYSQGFNPHPVLSLALPRPVGVATRDDLLILALDSEVPAQTVLDRLNAQVPRGLRFLSAELMSSRKAPRPAKAFYEIVLEGPPLEAARARLAELLSQAAWPAERITVTSRGQRSVSRAIDLRPLVEGIEIADGLLRFTLVRQGDAWARPAEFLRMLGLEDAAILARVVRTGAEYETLPAESVHPSPDNTDGTDETDGTPPADPPETE